MTTSLIARALGHDTNEPRDLAELVDHEALGYRAWHTPEGDFLAEQMERLAQLIRWTKATTPAEHTDRMDIWDEQIRSDWEARGYTRGWNDGLSQAQLVIQCSTGIHR